MVDYEKQFGLATTEWKLGKVFRIVYGWMAAALVISGVAAWYVFDSGLGERMLLNNGMTICLVAELALVFVLSFAINKLPAFVAFLMFIAYSLLNGVTLSVVFMAYELASVQQVFFITAGMFAGLLFYGSVTKDDLSSVGSFCGMALWGLIIALVVNLFFHSERLDWIVSFAGVLIFTGLTMYDAQKIRQLAAQEDRLDRATVSKLGLIGALNLYLDFVNLFLYILRFLGKKR